MEIRGLLASCREISVKSGVWSPVVCAPAVDCFLRCKTTKANLDKKELCSSCDKRIQKPGLGRQEQSQKKEGKGGNFLFYTHRTKQHKNPMSYPKADNHFSCSLSSRRRHRHITGKDGKPSLCLLLTE